ncbi:class I SAM-dependent methyltransferase [Paenibacillus monticola]|uniref:Methyltransferase domain-containing protein n=1 Tax=Paenibacillus monticola TaxID=2666075 RepID=A0A7X2L213_9BACL|nr:class I SAM-dependent methyltransferase [Paenibacillus monticola]MRN54367.1 methyltransferase domain-containing protein [Paenibacillus monticola]
MSNDFSTAEELMEHLKKQIVQYSNGEDVTVNYNFKPNFREMNLANDVDLTRLKHEIEGNNLLWNVSADHPITSHRKYIGKFIVFGKKAVRKLLKWYVSNPFNLQASFNGSVTRSINEMTNLLIVSKTRIEELEVIQNNLSAKISELNAQISLQNDYIGREYSELKQEQIIKLNTYNNEYNNTISNVIFPKLDEINGRVHFNEQKFRSEMDFVNYRIRKLKTAEPLGISEEFLHNTDEVNNQPINSNLKFDYLLFENRFRGSNDDIRNRQMKYLDYYKNKKNVLDIGCGRGEFIELLLENNITAKGIDLTDEMVEYCQDLGLPVEKQEAIHYLEQQEDNSLGGIFLGQVIEHIPFESIIRLVELARAKLMPGSYLIMETPNPQTLAIFSRSFYMDPTHVKPVHPLTVQFLAESVGFRETNLVYSGRVEKEASIPRIQETTSSIMNIEEINKSIDKLNDLLFGDQDYALIARK